MHVVTFWDCLLLFLRVVCLAMPFCLVFFASFIEVKYAADDISCFRNVHHAYIWKTFLIFLPLGNILECDRLCANFSDNKKQYIKWCKGCKNDFSFRTGCGLQNELRTAGLHSVAWQNCVSYKKSNNIYCDCKRQFLLKRNIFNLNSEMNYCI